MYQIDKISYDSPFASVHPGEKAVFSIISLIMVLSSGSVFLPLGVFLFTGMLLYFKGRLPFLFLIRLGALPVLFIMSAVLPVLISVSTVSFDSAHPLAGGFLYWDVSGENVEKSLLLLCRSLSAVMCFLFFILTTPISQIDYLLKSINVSSVFREMLILIYRYIFILSDFSSTVYTSQKARMGYSRFSISIKSLGQLIRAVFQKTDYYSEQAAMALQARSCDGEICFIRNPVTSSLKNRILVALFFIATLSLRLSEGLWPV